MFWRCGGGAGPQVVAAHQKEVSLHLTDNPMPTRCLSSVALRCLPVLFLSWFACGVDEPRTAPEGFYLPVHDTLPPPPRGIAALNANFTEIRNDSLYYSSLMYGAFGGYPVYAADTAARFGDSIYAVYQVVDDSTLQLRYHQGDTVSPPLTLRQRELTKLLPPSKEVEGRTYAFDLETLRVLVYFATVDQPMPTFESREGAPTAAVEIRATPRRRHQIGNRPISDAPPPVFSYAESIGPNRVAIHRVVLGQGTAGEVVAYLLKDDRQGGGVSGPFAGQRYPSPVPESEADQNLFNRLQRGRIERVIGSPDTGRVFSATTHPRYSSVRPEEVPTLDVEVREDGYYSLLSGPEILEEGQWGFSRDRNFLLLTPEGRYAEPDLCPITAYGDYLGVSLYIHVDWSGKRRPGGEGVGVRSNRYAEPTPLELRFYPPE